MKSGAHGGLASKVRVLEWSAWVPGVFTRDEWRAFLRSGKRSAPEAAPDVSLISPLLRRRMSRLTRMAVAVAADCCRRAAVPASDVPVVFASRHGEMGATVELLEQLSAGDALSPMGFSGAVHHTPLAYFSMAMGNRRASRAVAGGEASFCAGFLDAAGLLGEADTPFVLLVAADETLPAPFSGLIGKINVPYAAAFMLGRARPRQAGGVSLELKGASSGTKRSAAEPRSSGIPALDFLRWHVGRKKSLEWRLSERNWRWER